VEPGAVGVQVDHVQLQASPIVASVQHWTHF
jgi:hypothetical protein